MESVWMHWKKMDCKMRFAVRNVKVKAHASAKPDDLESVNAAIELLEVIKIDSLTRTDDDELPR